MRCLWTLGEKPDRDRESRDRKLFQLIEKSTRPVVLFIDDAHRLQAQTLAGLKGLVEKPLGGVLVGHPRVGFKLARGLMEEIGLRCEHLERRGLEGGGRAVCGLVTRPSGRVR
jgi:type II secretory pathway predicted ATPase ExeA